MTHLTSHKHQILASFILAGVLAARARDQIATVGYAPPKDDTLPAVTRLERLGALVPVMRQAVAILAGHDALIATDHIPAPDGSGVDWRLPYPVCLFEWLWISVRGPRRYEALCEQLDQSIRCHLIFDDHDDIPGQETWWVPSCYPVTFHADGTTDGGWEVNKDAGLLQILRGLCVLMDAGMTESTTVPAPERLNKARAKKGKVPIDRHIVIGLRREHRETAGAGGGSRHRLHMVRGHWRHYQDHNTWIKWHLRGDATLGTAPTPTYEVRTS